MKVNTTEQINCNRSHSHSRKNYKISTLEVTWQCPIENNTFKLIWIKFCWKTWKIDCFSISDKIAYYCHCFNLWIFSYAPTFWNGCQSGNWQYTPKVLFPCFIRNTVEFGIYTLYPTIIFIQSNDSLLPEVPTSGDLKSGLTFSFSFISLWVWLCIPVKNT